MLCNTANVIPFSSDFESNLISTLIGTLLSFGIALFIFRITTKSDQRARYDDKKTDEAQLIIALHDYLIPNIESLKLLRKTVNENRLIYYRLDARSLSTIFDFLIKVTHRIELRRELMHAIFQLNALNALLDAYNIDQKNNYQKLLGQITILNAVYEKLLTQTKLAMDQLKDYITIQI